MAKKKDWKEIENSDISKNYRRLMRLLECLKERRDWYVVSLGECTNEEVHTYLNKNYFLVLSSDDFALIDAYHCQYQGKRVAKKRYPELGGTICGLSFIVSDAFGYTDLWEKKFVNKTLNRQENK